MNEAVRRNARRVLAIGAASIADGTALDQVMVPEAMLIVLEEDPARADRVRGLLSAAGLADRTTIIVGNPERRLHKLAGPFDLILCAADHLAVRARLGRLLAPDGMFVST